MRSAITTIMLAGLLLGSLPAAAQYELGDLDLSKLSGIVGLGYTGGYGDQESSNHTLSLNGSSTLNGYYYTPNFLSFNLTPYLNQSRANSESRSVDDSSGIAFSSAIFSGSHFPGAVTYNWDRNSSGVFSIPGEPNINTHGNDDSLGVSWGVNLPQLPNVSFFYNRTTSSATLYGTDTMTAASSQIFAVRSQYNLAGFQLTGSYNHSRSNSEIPEVLPSSVDVSSSTSDGYSFGAAHKIPFNGSAVGGYSHTDFNADALGYHDSGSVNNAYGSATLAPTDQFSVIGNVNYVDNLIGSLEQILLSGGVAGQLFTSSGSHSLDSNAIANYKLPHNILASGLVGLRRQYFEGQNYTAMTFGGGLSTSQNLLKGIVTGFVRAEDYRTDAIAGGSSSNSLSLVAGTSYSRDVGKWRVTGNLNYSQNQETILVNYLSSFLSYGGTVFRPVWKVRWTASFSATHSAIVQQPGDSNHSESFSTGVFHRYITASAGYSQGMGSGVLTPSGITPSPVPIPLSLTSFNGKSYNFSLGSSPIRRLTLSAAYSRSHGDTSAPGLLYNYQTKSFNALTLYRWRQMGFTGGYSRLQQAFGVSTVKPFDGTTYYLGVNRWFNFF